MRSVKTVTCDGLQYWSCASQDLCDTRDTGVSQAAQAVYLYRSVGCAQAVYI